MQWQNPEPAYRTSMRRLQRNCSAHTTAWQNQTQYAYSAAHCLAWHHGGIGARHEVRAGSARLEIHHETPCKPVWYPAQAGSWGLSEWHMELLDRRQTNTR